jgi:type IV fimbrial biogenesis protein FimT
LIASINLKINKFPEVAIILPSIPDEKDASSQRVHTSKIKGFTLIELLVTLSIVGVLVAIALPSFAQMVKANQIQSAASEFQAALALARTEAIKRGGDARVTIVANSLAAGDANWASGVTVFFDRTSDASANAPPAAVVGTPSPILMKTAALSSGISLTFNAGNHVIYNGLGRSISSTGAQLSGSFAFGPAANTPDADYRCVIISATGRARAVKLSTADYAANNNKCPSV